MNSNKELLEDLGFLRGGVQAIQDLCRPHTDLYCTNDGSIRARQEKATVSTLCWMGAEIELV